MRATPPPHLQKKSIALDVFIMSLHYLKNEEGMKRVLDYTLVNEQFVILP